MDNATFSATAVQCYRATTKRFNVNFCDNDRINHLVVAKISGILKMSEDSVAMFAIDETTHLVQITANEDTIVTELNLTMAIVELLQVFMDLSMPISSIEQIDYPVICFGSIKLLVQQNVDGVTIEIYNHFDVLSGKWTNIRLQDDLSKSTAEKTEKAIAVESESPTLKCMLKIGIDCTEENRHETFTSIGLDSLKTAELEMALQADYPNYRIPTGIVHRCPTVAEMDAYLLSRADIFDINKDTTVYSHHIPLSSQQKRLLFMNELNPARNAQFNENLAFSISYENFDERRLLMAMNSVIMRHTILRTSYTIESQRIHSGTESFLAILKCDVALEEFVSFPVDISKCCLQFCVSKSADRIAICLVVHHIAVDGHSISIITQEIEAFYTGAEPQTINPRQYVDYCILTSDLPYSNELAEWSRKLQGREFQLLPTDKPRTSAKSCNGAVLQKRLTNKLQESMKKIRKLANCTNFCVFVAIYKFLIYKTTGIVDFPIGFSSTSRRKEFWSTVGCFVNTTPLLEVVNPSITVSKYILDISAAISEARRIDVPLDVLVSHLKIDRSDDMLPIFQVLLVMDNIKAPPPNQGIVVLDLSNRLAKYEQTWYFQDNGTSFDIRVEYNCELFRAETISDLLDRFLYILDDFGKNSCVRFLKDITITTKSEQKSFIETSTLNRGDFPKKTVLQIFQKSLYSKSSVIFKKQRINYRELDEKSSHMAADICRVYCNHYGELPSRDRCAAVFMKRSLELPVTIVAIWKIGLTAVPISLDWPPERTIETLKMFENPIVIENDFEGLKNTAGYRIFPLIIPRSVRSSMSKWWNTADLFDLAYITCTSGTTGKPKAVCTEFYGHSNLAAAYTRMFLIREQSHIYQVVNYGFDIFFADLSKTLVNGATMTLAAELIPNLEEMNDVTNAYIMPIYLSSLSITDINSLNLLESIQFGGETIQALALRRLLETDISIYQEYGVTEQTVYTNCNRINVRSAISEIGKPHCNLYTVVRDPNEQLLPLKYQGIHYLGGCGLARGYYSDPMLTASVIQQGLLGKEFRSGDMVKSENGRLQFVGRDDLQIQYHIGQHDDVEANIVGVDDNDGVKELVAYVILKASKESTDAIRSFLSSRLPGYCIPKYFISLKEFPVNQNGKVDISQFPKPRQHSTPSNLRHPRNKLETTVITSFRKYTGRDHMANESFFARGGDSIKAMLVLQDLAAQGLHIDLKSFFSLQTAEKIAAFLNENSMPLRKSRDDKTLSCNISLSAQQRRLWFLVKKHPNRDSYVIRLHIDFIGVLIKKRLLESFNLVIMNNSLLRSIISLINHEPTFLTLSGTECFYALEPNELEDVQVTDSSLVIGQLFEGDCSRLDLRIHHIISDGRSLAIIAEQLAGAYNSVEIIPDDNLPENDELDDSLAFWRQYLEGYEPISVQRKAENDDTDGKSGYLIEELDFIDSLKLEEFCANYCCTLYHIVMLSFVNALRMTYDLNDVVVGTTVANRSPVNLNRVGLFANTVPLRFRKEFPDLERQLRYTIDQILSAMEHQSTSLARIVEDVVNDRDSTTINPLFEHVVTFESASLSNFPSMNGLRTKVTEVKSEFVQFDQSWIFHPGKKLSLLIQYNTGRYSLDSVKELLTGFKKTLLNTLRNSTLGFIRQPEKNALFYDIPRNRCLGRIFREQAGMLPYGVCLESNYQTTTYSDALRMSEKFAHRMENAILRHHGVTPAVDDFICLILNESIENHIAIEAVHLLGCAYLSMSPDTPIERIRHVIMDCQPKLIVTDLHFQTLPLPTLLLELLEPDRSPRFLFRSCSNSLAYVIYTSGTTGSPKGVCVSHQSTLNMLAHATRHYNFRPMAKVLQLTKSSFDASISNTFGCLLNGGVLSVTSGKEEIISDLCARQPITTLHMTPIILDMLDNDDFDQLHDVERWSFGGETMSESTMNSMIERGYRIVQLYGPTETTCYVTLLEMRKTITPTCLGPVISGLFYGLCSFQNHMAQRKSIGQFYCSGENLARGYIGSAQKGFVENPYRTIEDKILLRNTKIYLSGDRISCDENQYLQFLGREDDQVKIKGQRIQLSEIENVARKVDGVQNAAAVLQKDKANMNHIVLFHTGTANNLLTFLRERLQNYMVPSKIIHLVKFPLTTNGKIDKKNLSSRSDIKDNSTSVQIPKDYFEEGVLNSYREVLKQPDVNVCSNFFQVGGHSLLAVRLVDAIQNTFGVSVPIVKVFEFPVVADLARWIKNCQNPQIIPAISKELCSKENDKPTPLQLTLLRSFRNPQVQALYEISFNIMLKKLISAKKLRKIVNNLTMIHPSLRTRFVRIHKKCFKEVLSGTECYQKLDSKATLGLDLLQKPPFVICADGKNLHLVVNHIITDGHSMHLVVRNLLRLLSGEQIAMDDSHLFHSWIHNQFQELGADHRQYWGTRLKNFVYNQLPTSHPRLVIRGKQAASLNFHVSQLRKRIDSWAHTYCCTPFVAVLALLSRTLQSISYDPSMPVAIGFPVNLRTHKLQNSVAYGISTVMIAHDTTESPEKVVGGISMEVAQAMSHAFLPYDQLMELSPSKKLFSAMLTFDDYSVEENEIFRVDHVVVATTKFELSIFVDSNSDCIRVEYNKELYKKSFIESLMDIFNSVVSDWFAIPKQIFHSKARQLLRVDGVIYDTIDIQHHLESLALSDLHVKVSNSKSVELFYSCDTNKNEVIREKLKQLPEPLRPKRIFCQPKNTFEFPLSTQQLQMYYLSHEKSSFYVLPFLKKFSKTIPASHIQKALLYEIQRHESLRTIFFEFQGEPRQLVLSMTEGYIGLNVEKTANLKRSLTVFIKSSVDLSEGVPLRAVLFETPDYFVAMLRLHHIISDAWSTRMLEQELGEILEKLNASENPEFLRQTLSYKKYCLEAQPTPVINSLYIDALTESDYIPEMSYHGGVEVLSFDFSESVAHQWMKRCRVSFFVVMLKILSKTIMNEYGLRSINIGSASSGRSPGLKNVFGYFLNNLVFHIRQEVELKSPETLQQHVAEVISRNIPYPQLVDTVRQRVPHLRPLFQVYFNCRYDMETHKDDDIAVKSLLPVRSEFPFEIDLDKNSTGHYVTLRVQDCLPKGVGESLMKAIQSALLTGTSHQSVPIKNQISVTYPLELVLQIAKKVLLLETIDYNENFFSIGGNSLQAIAFIEQIEETVGVEVNISTVYQMKSFLKFSDYLRSVIPTQPPETPNENVQASGGPHKIGVASGYPFVPLRKERSTFKNFCATDTPCRGLNTMFHEMMAYGTKQALFEPDVSQVTYEELADMIARKAATVRDHYCQITGETLRADTIIPVLGQRSASTIITCLSVMASGSAYLPMDSSWPLKRLCTLLDDSHANCYVGPKIAEIDLPNIMIKPMCKKNCQRIKSDSVEDLAYVIYTSGTTGIPKAVCINRSSLINTMASSTVGFRIRTEDVIYQFTMFVYDNSVLEIFMTLTNGARLVIAQGEFLPRTFTNLLTNHGITHCLLFPGVVSTFRDANFKKLSTLRYWIVGAEKLPQNLLNRAIDEGINVIQNYGPTETTAYALTKHMKNRDYAENIGRPIQNTTISVTEKGQLLIKGRGVMRGYLKKHSHYLLGKDEWYSTGDRVQLLPNGDVLFVDRADSQVKIHGHRVELSEIETTITSLGGVGQCKVVWRATDEKLLAFCTRQPKDNLNEELVYERCRKSLPKHMCPTHVIFLDRFPLTKNSKIDLAVLSENWKDFLRMKSFLQLLEHVLGKKPCSSLTLLEVGGSTRDAIALKRLYFSMFGGHLNVSKLMKIPLKDIQKAELDTGDNQNHVNGNESLTHRLRRVWSKVLKHQNFCNNDHFYFCGGNSMSLTKLRYELNKEFRTNFEVRDLLKVLVFNDMMALFLSTSVLTRIVTVVHHSTARPQYLLIFVHTLYGGCTAYANLIHHFRRLGSVDVLMVEHPNTFRFETDEPRFHENIQLLADSYYAEIQRWLDSSNDGGGAGDDDVGSARVALIGASIGGTIAFEMSKHSRSECDVIIIDSGTDYEKLHELKFGEHFKSINEALLNHELDDETRFWMVVNSWDLLQMLKGYKLSPSPNLRTLTVFSVDGTDLGWSRKIAGTHFNILSSENSDVMAAEIVRALSL
ncbi:unnamed protein product [Angiostrongylus costaricensis]|uniref:Fatty acid synthase n=1 Tax=Angiostrongylus costaricensis TaxID=334426 RepID=A0A0R3PW71_ANGCS|nr:unnamed protein product [Angiostrongylus costaricensis]